MERAEAICVGNLLQESRNRASISPWQIRPFPRARNVGRHSPWRRRGGKGREKFLVAKIQRNPLKRLDSDERIQGNPSFSNPQKRGFPKPNGEAPRKPKSALDQPSGPPRRNHRHTVGLPRRTSRCLIHRPYASSCSQSAQPARRLLDHPSTRWPLTLVQEGFAGNSGLGGNG